jgi:O-antigen/teichoic acid export membrane protein
MTDTGLPRLFRQTTISQSLGIYLPTMIAYRIVGFARAPVLAFLMIKGDWGVFQIAVLITTVLHPLCSLGLCDALGRYTPAYETRGSLKPFLRRSVPSAMGVSAVLCAVLFIEADPVGRFLFEEFGSAAVSDSSEPDYGALMRVVALATLSLIGYWMVLAVLRGLRMFVAFSLVELISNIGFALVAIGVALSGFNSANAILCCFLVDLALTAIVFAMLLARALRKTGPTVSAPRSVGTVYVMRQMLRFSLPMAAAAILGQSLQIYPSWYLLKVHGEELVAEFQAVRHLTQAVLLFAVAVTTVVAAGVTKTWEAQGPEAANRKLQFSTKATGLVILIGCALYIVVSRWVMLIYREEYQRGIEAFSLTLVFFLVGSFLAFVNVHFTLIEKTRHLLWAWLAGSIANVAFGTLLIHSDQSPVEALHATGWTGVAAVTATLLTFTVLVRIERRPVDRGTWILILSSYLFLLPMVQMLAAVAVFFAVIATTRLVLNAQEKHEIRQQCVGGWHRLRSLTGSR